MHLDVILSVCEEMIDASQFAIRGYNNATAIGVTDEENCWQACRNNTDCVAAG